MAKSRLDMRREVEAAEALEKTSPKKKSASKSAATKKTAKKKARKKAATRSRKAKDTPTRRRLVWVIYSSTMREEGRFLYHERDKAEEKLEQLLSKGKRRYFIQPIKEPLDSEGRPLSETEEEVTPAVEEVPEKPKKVAKATGDDDDDDDDEASADADTPDADAESDDDESDAE